MIKVKTMPESITKSNGNILIRGLKERVKLEFNLLRVLRNNIMIAIIH